MKRLIDWLGTNANKVRQWVEGGDLILPLIVISVAHYAAVLEKKDFWFVAFAIGVLIDLASYRLVKAAIEHGGWFWVEALVMSLFAFAFHLEFYVGGVEWFYPMAAAAIPTCLIFLAHLSVVEHWERKIKKQLPVMPSVPVANDVIAGGKQIAMPKASRWQYAHFVARHKAQPLNARQIVEQGGVPLRTAYNWLAKAEQEHNQVGFKT